MRRSLFSLIAAAAMLAGCASTSGPIVVGQVDPERILAPAEDGAGNCVLRKRASISLGFAGLPLVSVQINGRSSTLILDTGAEGSILNAGAAARLGVTNRYDFVRNMRGIGNTVQTGDARLESMSLGGMALTYPRMLVGGSAITINGVQTDGLLGASLLGEFDLDIDLPHRRLELYDRMDCTSMRPPWSGQYETVQTTRSLTSHPFFPVSVNGRGLSASLDSGAERTVIAATAAQRAGIGNDSRLAGPEIKARGAAGELVPAALHQLRDFRISGVAVRTPVLVIPITLPRDIDALIGADFLQQHRVWLSYGARRLFIQ